MMPAMTVPYLNVPPSYNTLDPFQRARLVQSTRKLGRVLGTTPILRDPSASTSERITLPIGPKSGLSGSRSSSPSPARSQASQRSKSSRRQGSLFEVPLLENPAANQSTSSLSSLSSQNSTQSLPESRSFAANRRRNIDVPSPLHLASFTDNDAAAVNPDVRLPPRIDAMTARMGMAPDALVRAHRRVRSSSAASTSTLHTPLTPSFRLRAAANPAHRREVLQKLERTLGEPVPPSLVFPADSLERAALAAVSSANASSPDLAVPASAPNDAEAETTQLRPPSPDVPPRSPSLDLPREMKLYIAGPVRRASSTLAASTRSAHRRSASMNGLQSKARNPRGSSHWQAPEEWRMGPTSPIAERADAEDEADTGGDGEFLGIWNAENYESVMLRLRSLRV